MEKIIKLAPSYKDYLWGGTKLREITERAVPVKKWQRAGKFPAILTDHLFIAEGEQEECR